MTNLEAIREDLSPYPIRTSQIERQCIKQGISPHDDKLDEQAISMCVLEILSQMIALGGVSEGGVSFSFNVEGAKDRVRSICKRNGLNYTDYVSVPTVTRLE
jgi:hypothetical protein